MHAEKYVENAICKARYSSVAGVCRQVVGCLGVWDPRRDQWRRQNCNKSNIYLYGTVVRQTKMEDFDSCTLQLPKFCGFLSANLREFFK